LRSGSAVSRKAAKEAKTQRKPGFEITLTFAIYDLLLCVFAPFASLREAFVTITTG